MIRTAVSGPQSDAYVTLGCRFDAAAVQMIVVVHAVGFALMSVDRLLAVRSAAFSTDHRGLTLCRVGGLIAVAWLCSVGVALPLVVPNAVDVEGESRRYLCTADHEAPAAYAWTVAVVGYVCPIVVTLGLVVATAASAIQHSTDADQKANNQTSYLAAFSSAVMAVATSVSLAAGINPLFV